MKYEAYRSSTIRRRLATAAEAWLSESPSRAFETKKGRFGFFPGNPILIGLLYSCAFLVTLISAKEGPVLASLIIPILAAISFFQICRLGAAQTSAEVTHLLPLANRRIGQVTRRSYLGQFSSGLVLATLIGAVGGQPTPTFLGAMQGALLYLAFLTSLTLVFTWRFFHLTLLAAALFVVLFLIGRSNAETASFAASLWKATPWYRSFVSPLTLAIFLLFGLTAAWFTRHAWAKIAHFDRTNYYEQFDGQSFVEDDSEDEEPAPIKRPNEPRGLIERLVWKILTPKEKALLRSIDETRLDFFTSWLKGSSLVVFIIWLTAFPWPGFLEDCKVLAAVIAVITAISIFPKDQASPLRYLQGMAIGPQAVAARFHALPLTFTAVESLMWKKYFLHWPLLTLTACLTLQVHPGFRASLSDLPFHFLTLLPVVLHVHWLFFWNASISDWTAKGMAHFVTQFFITTFLVIGIIFVFVFIVTGIVLIEGDLTPLPASLPLTIWSCLLVNFLILRILIHSLIKNPRTDLLRQS